MSSYREHLMDEVERLKAALGASILTNRKLAEDNVRLQRIEEAA